MISIALRLIVLENCVVLRMLELILVGLIGFVIMIFFYKQAICEYRLNQIDWAQRDKVGELINEKVPIVVRGRPATAFWTQEDILLRGVYDRIPLFEASEKPFSQWIMDAGMDTVCPWGSDHGKMLGAVSGLDRWSERILSPLLGWSRYFLWTDNCCWVGARGLMKMTAPWTAIICTQGEILVTLMTENYEKSLPVDWRGRFPAEISTYDTPFAGDLKYFDVIVRTGTVLFVPAHWFVSWTAIDSAEVCPMVCTVEWHSVISRVNVAVAQ